MSTPGWFARLLVATMINLSAVAVVAAQEPEPRRPALDAASPDPWTRVAAVPAGRVVRVEVGSARSIRGRVASVQPDGISLAVGRSQQTISRSEIRTVALVQRQTGRKAKRGLIIGAIAGGVMGRLTAGSARLAWMAFLAAEYSVIGAAIGAIDGHFDKAELLLYDAGAMADSRAWSEDP